ncbi:hypothetical protein A8990_13262 [Paenibacillus taihuensis]|uniref:Uncharacterized protein n=1 Tax=Paenibacillus taihuensis TaxID=1156355 RepID=A0A3D9QWR0_9BACL|nr:hypothetical protein [Paenibacillus taihuensis]REE69664.1 hypothetical protein A8990_13262 [Paenibacillus taihuensis]
MPNELSTQLLEAKERMQRLNKAERRREELLRRVNNQERIIVQLELQLEKEQADVDKLTKMSLANLFHTILRSKEEQLELERQQALAAALKLQEEKQRLVSTQENLRQLGDELAQYTGAEREYHRLMAVKESALRGATEHGSKLIAMDDEIADQTLQLKEIQEALTAGNRVVSALEDASTSLEKAENWGNWDTWGGGGLISTSIKHEHVDHAKSHIQNANHLLHAFRDELDDLNQTINIQIDISGTLKMADYWFDGLITDWIVQGRIKNSQQQTLDALNDIRSVVRDLQSKQASGQASLSALQTKRQAWIEMTNLE